MYTNVALSADSLSSSEDILDGKIIFHGVLVNKNNHLCGTKDC